MSRAPGGKKPVSDRTRLRIHLELMINFLTLGQPPQGRRGTRLARRGAARHPALRPPADLSRTGRLGALQTARGTAPASSSRRPGAAAPRCAALAPALAPATSWPLSTDQPSRRDAENADPGPRDNPPRPARSHLHLHLGTEKFQEPRLPGWTRQAQHGPCWGSGDLDSTGSVQTEEGKPRPRAGTPGVSPAHLNVGPLLPHPAQAVTFLSLCPEDFTPHPACSPNSDFEPKRVQEYLRPGHSQQALWPSPKQLQVGITVPGQGNPTEAGSCFPKLYPGEVRGIH